MKRNKKMFPLAALVAGFMVFGIVELSPAQDKSGENLQILLEQANTEKKKLVAANMELTESEATGFWPVFEEYQKDLAAINLRIVKMLESYAVETEANTLTDEKAQRLIDELVLIEQADGLLHATYAPKLGKVLPPKKVARYLQIENKLRALVRYSLSRVPLIVP